MEELACRRTGREKSGEIPNEAIIYSLYLPWESNCSPPKAIGSILELLEVEP